jgi:hypothetical protein
MSEADFVKARMRKLKPWMDHQAIVDLYREELLERDERLSAATALLERFLSEWHAFLSRAEQPDRVVSEFRSALETDERGGWPGPAQPACHQVCHGDCHWGLPDAPDAPEPIDYTCKYGGECYCVPLCGTVEPDAPEPSADISLDTAAERIVAAARAANCAVSYSLESLTHTPEAANCRRCRWEGGCRRAESAEAQLAAVREGIEAVMSDTMLSSGEMVYSIRAPLTPAPSPGAGEKS